MQHRLTLDTLHAEAQGLGAADKLLLAERLVGEARRETLTSRAVPTQGLWGLCRDLGTAPGVEEIEATRREHQATYPDEGIG